MLRGSRQLAAAIILAALVSCSGGSEPDTASSSHSPSTISSTSTSANAEESQKGAVSPQLDSIAVMGHSGATGTLADVDHPERDATEFSWATGESPRVESVYYRLLETHPAMQGHNYNVAVDGSDVDNLVPQLDSLLQKADPLPDVVIVQSIDNDIQCDGSDPEHYVVFADALKENLGKIQQAIPGVALFLVSQWADVRTYARVAGHLESVRRENSGNDLCSLFTAEDRKRRPEGERSLQDIVDHYWDEVVQVCGSLPDCYTDGGAEQNFPLALKDLASDGNHLAVSGHAKMAAIAWKAFPQKIKDRD